MKDINIHTYNLYNYIYTNMKPYKKTISENAPQQYVFICNGHLYMRWLRIYMQWPPMCAIDLYVMAANINYMRWPPMCAIDLYVMAANIYAMASYMCDGRKYINCHKYAMAEYACDDRKGYTSSGRRHALQLH